MIWCCYCRLLLLALLSAQYERVLYCFISINLIESTSDKKDLLKISLGNICGGVFGMVLMIVRNICVCVCSVRFMCVC